MWLLLGFRVLKQVVHVVTTGLQSVNAGGTCGYYWASEC
jgi:hypothetical protein